MSKYRDRYYIQFPRRIFKEEISWKAKWLFTVLCELEHQFSGEKEDYFFRTQQDLSRDTGMTPKSNRKYRKELEEKGLIQTWKMHWFDKESGKKSEKHTVAFRILI